MRTTYVPPLTAETAKEKDKEKTKEQKPAESQPESQAAFADLATKPPKCDVLLVGLDLGTNASCVKAAYADSHELVVNAVAPTVVGYARKGIVQNLLPRNASTLFGEEAVKHRIYLRMVRPLAHGVVEDMAAARDYAGFLLRLMKPPEGVELRAVVGLPANADRSARENLCRAFSGVFNKVMFIPEPFLAALGYRDESRLSDPAYIDPVRNALFADIGAGTTDVCMVQGYFPTAEDQVSVDFAGDTVDNLLQQAIRRAHPDIELPMARVREIKEQHSFVGSTDVAVTVQEVIGGKRRKLELGEAVGSACQQLLVKVFDCVTTMIGKASTETVAGLLQNIVLTGGGSRIRNIDSELQRLLAEDGFEKPRVQTVGDNYKQHVAKGALVAARQAAENQWTLI